ncbi:MAG TPA: hypothetical protein PLK08_03320 [Phycisphaerae bacterium]|nr:hypothetical protein [Phycisphaerae bacterium]
MGSGRHLKNLSASWVGYAANFIILMYLSRLVVRSLGEELFGVWSLIVSVTGYMGLADIGLRNGLGRFINFYQGKGETRKVNEVISTSMTFFVFLGIPIFVASWFIGENFCWLFQRSVPQSLADGCFYAMLLTGANLWLGFLASPYSLAVISQDRFDLFHVTNLVVLGVRAAGTVIVMKNGGGIVQLAMVQVISNLVAVTVFFVIGHRVYPPLYVRPSLANMLRFKELFGFSFWAFLSAIATKLLYFTDIIVIGATMHSAVFVTLYSIPLTLIDHSRNFVGQVTEVLTPRTIKMSSRNDFASLQLMLKWGSKLTMFFAIPFFTGLMFFGPKFMALFWGEKFWQSKWVLVLLVVPQYTAMAVRIGGSIISGLGHIKVGALITLLQAGMNLILTLIFILLCGMGIEGVALGTLVPMVIFNVIIAILLHRWVHGSIRRFFTTNVLRWLLSLAGMLIFGYAAKSLAIDSAKYFGAFWDGWLRFGFGLLFYTVGAMLISWFLGFNTHEREILVTELSSILPWKNKRKPQ